MKNKEVLKEIDNTIERIKGSEKKLKANQKKLIKLR